MTTPILELKNLTKTYVLGNRKNAYKAQRAIQKLQRKLELREGQATDEENNELETRLQLAQEQFAAEKFEDSYKTITDKSLRPRPKDRGSVVHALTNVSLTVSQGELLAIMGPSGSGKSTLLNMLGLLDRPTAGRVYINNTNVSDIRSRDLPGIRSKELGFVFQSFNLVSTLTALENVMLPLRYAGVGLARRREMARQALEQVGLGDRLYHSPNELSGGQQQRVAIARSIVNSPAIIFGDELTGELDSKMTKEIMDLVIELNKGGQSFIIVTHNPDVAKRCHRVITMKDGRIERDLSRRR